MSVTTEELAKAIGRELPDTIATQLDELITHATSIVGNYLGQPLELIQETETIRAFGDNQRIHLSNTPIGSVTSITIDDDDVDLEEDIRVAENYIDFRWPIAARRQGVGVDVIVEYFGGIDLTATGSNVDGWRAREINSVILDVSARLARRMLDDRGDITSLKLEGYAVVYADGGQVGLLDAEKQRLARYRRLVGRRSS